MKKLGIIVSIVLNVVLVFNIVSLFNPLNLPLMELEYFTGFDIINLFPTDIESNIQMILSIVALILINISTYKIVNTKKSEN